MIIHILIFLAKQLAKSQAPPPVRERKQKIGDVVIDCPSCGTLAVSAEYALERASGKPQVWRQYGHVIECGSCRETVPAEKFENDGTGVMRARTWICPECSATNSYVSFNCPDCRAWYTPPATAR